MAPIANVLASGETLAGGSAVNAVAGEESSITGLQVNGNGNDNINIRLYIPEDSGNLKMTTTTGLTFFDNEEEGNLLQFSGNRNDINTALATLKFTGYELGDVKIEISMTGPGQFYNPANGHLYEVVNADESQDNEITWNDAKTEAEAKTAFGVSGYLGTITSADENSFVTQRMSSGGWFGASDSATEGDWKWIAGPEIGISFWSGDSSGHAVSGRYSNWSDGEPNDYDNGDPGEDCAQVMSGANGLWNDLPCNGTQSSYLVEYGSDGDLPDVPYLEKTVHVNGKQINISNCSEFESINSDPASIYADISLTSDIDCHGATVRPLFADDSFRGKFDGKNHTIRNVVAKYDGWYDNVGLFASSTNADFIDLNLENITANGYSYVGGLVGSASGGNFENIHGNNLSIYGKGSSLGGLIGGYFKNDSTASTTLHRLSVEGDVGSDGGNNTGGLIGELSLSSSSPTTISESFANAHIQIDPDDAYSVGGLIGYIYGNGDYGETILNIENTYAWGSIASGVDINGGLIGQIYADGYSEDTGFHVSVKKSYADIAITAGISHADNGALVGRISSFSSSSSVSITNSFGAGKIDNGAGSSKGGLVGKIVNPDNITFTNNFYDKTKTTANNCDVDDSISSGCTAVNTNGSQGNYFVNNNTNAPLNTWDFDGIWVKQASTGPKFGWGEVGESGSDNDGISDAVENAAPNGGDANNDGVLDSQQANVASYVNPVTGSYSVLQVPSACSITSVSTINETSNAVKDAGYNYPAGLMNFAINCGTPGFVANIVQLHYGTGGTMVLRKYNPNTNAYFNIVDAAITNQTIGGKQVMVASYQVADGGILDLDNQADGTIVDPAGLALQAVGVPNTGL